MAANTTRHRGHSLAIHTSYDVNSDSRSSMEQMTPRPGCQWDHVPRANAARDQVPAALAVGRPARARPNTELPTASPSMNTA